MMRAFTAAFLFCFAGVAASSHANDATDWTALCGSEAAALSDARHAKYVFIDNSAPDTVTRTLVVPKSFVSRVVTGKNAASTGSVTLTFVLPDPPADKTGASQDRPAAVLAGLKPASTFDKILSGTVSLRLTVSRNYWLRDWRQRGANAGVDPESGLEKINIPRESPVPFEKGNDHFARLEGSRRQMLYNCDRGVGATCSTEFDRIEDVQAGITFSRSRLRQTPELEATVHALIRCFTKGGA